jgi:hypothetical protein
LGILPAAPARRGTITAAASGARTSSATASSGVRAAATTSSPAATPPTATRGVSVRRHGKAGQDQDGHRGSSEFCE